MPDRVLIVGAGPTGLTAALELSRLGIPVRIIDKQAAPPTTSRAIGVQARTLELLEQRGLIVARSETNPPDALTRSATVLARAARLLHLPMHLHRGRREGVSPRARRRGPLGPPGTVAVWQCYSEKWPQDLDRQ
jgi:2-polyprenyl-6-methoxyphenol hydroxylase-like FAD-dependent oxidoreductase